MEVHGQPSTTIQLPQTHVEKVKSTGQKARSPPVAINVHIDDPIRKYLQLPHGYRKVRISVSTKEESEISISAFRKMVENRIPPLANQPYQLRFKQLPTDLHYQTLQSDADYLNLLKVSVADKVPLLFRLQGIPGVFPPPNGSVDQLPANPHDTPSYKMVSFFSFHPIEDLKAVQELLFELWKPMEVLGRIYIAREGINAQMAIPANIFEYFVQRTKTLPYFAESRFNTDKDVSREEYERYKPFRNLHIRIRHQIVADGLEEEEEVTASNPTSAREIGLDWRKSGKELTPLEWHQSLSQGLKSKDPSSSTSTTTDKTNGKSGITILDCRNTYETDVGIFESAIPLNTTFFRESWTALDEILEDVPKDQPIYTYCTGGIRCVKINAYLEQKLGFNNTYRLQGGIIAYRRELEKLKEQQANTSDLQSKFHGINYVFDERIWGTNYGRSTELL